MYSLGQAAKATGRSKSALSRDIKAGKISATRNADGSLSIDPAELHRVYPAVSHGNGSDNTRWDDSQPVVAQTDNRVLLARENALLREQLADRDETIRRLWERVSAEAEERREVQRRLTAVLTHRQSGTVPTVQATVLAVRRPWWRFW
jgi:hypothetical protein